MKYRLESFTVGYKLQNLFLDFQQSFHHLLHVTNTYWKFKNEIIIPVVDSSSTENQPNDHKTIPMDTLTMNYERISILGRKLLFVKEIELLFPCQMQYPC